jgi:hypothetical protein
VKYAKIFLTFSSTLIVAASVFGMSAQARKSDVDQCTMRALNKAECACEMALEKGTKKALRDYLKLYRNADTACDAMASIKKITEDSNGDELGSGTSADDSSDVGSTLGNPGNNKSVGHAGESPNGGNYGNGQKGKSQ